MTGRARYALTGFLVLAAGAAGPRVRLAAQDTTRGLDARTVLRSVEAAMGAANLTSIRFTGRGAVYTHGQALTRFGPLPRFDVTSLTYAADYTVPGSRVERVRVQGANPPRGGGPQPVIGEERTVSLLNGSDAWAVGANGSANRQPNGQGLDADTVEQRQIELWETPHGFLAAAAKSPTVTVTERRVGGQRLRTVSFPRGRTHMDGDIDDANHVIRVETWIAHPVLGDLSMETVYGGYRDWNGIAFPTRVTERWGGEVVLDLTVTEVAANAPVDLAVPRAVRDTPVPPVSHVVTTRLADGIYAVGGQNANTIVVEYADYVIAIEAGTHQERSKAVMAEIARLSPGKAIRYLVNTHAQYNDHAAGVRPYAAAGATIVTHADNKKWFEEVAFRGTWTIEPDALSRSRAHPRIETVNESRTYGEGERRIVLYHVAGNQHDASMLMAYLPGKKWLIEADSFSTTDSGGILFGPPEPPVGAPADFPRCCDARNFYDNVVQLRLDVETIVPIHGVPCPWALLETFLGTRRG